MYIEGRPRYSALLIILSRGLPKQCRYRGIEQTSVTTFDNLISHDKSFNCTFFFFFAPPLVETKRLTDIAKAEFLLDFGAPIENPSIKKKRFCLDLLLIFCIIV
jgi:hypothetical protein